MLSVTQAMLDAEEYMYHVGGGKNQAFFTACNPVYLFTNDHPFDILSNLDLSGSLLSVTSSFDHQLNAILLGCKDIRSFDINRNAKYFAELKIEAIKQLSYEEFKEFYKLYRRLGKKIKCDAIYKNLDRKVVSKLCESMDYTMGFYFQTLLKEGFFDMTDTTGYFGYISKPSNNLYLDEKTFYELKERLKDVKFREYIDCDIFRLMRYIEKEIYSAMVFSNISSYMTDEDLEKFYTFLKSIEENLTQNGKVQIGNGLINNRFSITGGNPINREFVLKYKDNIEEIRTKKEIITYYHK